MNEDEIRKQAQLYALVAEMHAAHAGVEGMKAANMMRESRGESMAYPENSFNDAGETLCAIAHCMREIFHP